MADVQEPRNALWRREEQLRRWDLSETNRESALPRNREKSKIKFQDGCIFLAACSSGDKDEVERLLARGADINTANIDGLTALHQACIDDNIDMVKFLVERGADIDACDNEGWTALHATTSCGFLEIAKFLIESGANVSAVNNDGELAYDIAEGDEMELLLMQEMETQGVDAEAARNEEEDMMLRDANQILNRVTSGAPYTEALHPKTGASALHIAAAKGYINVINVLLQAGVSVNSIDFDGWTPLHAAAHWGQEEAARIIVENFCDMEVKNLAGQTPFDVAEADIQLYLEELKKNQATLKRNEDKDVILLRPGPPPFKRSTDKWANVELDLSISDIYNRNDVSSVTRMSVEEKDKVVQKTQEEEREMRKKVIDEKDEEKRSESSADEASSSDSETENYVVFVPTEKQNEINRQSYVSKRTEEPTSPPPAPAPSELASKVPQELPAPVDDSEKAETKPPPGEPRATTTTTTSTTTITTPRIQDIVNSGERADDAEADKENERVSPPKETDKSDLISRMEEHKKATEQNQESSSNEEDAEAPGFVPKSITSNTTTSTNITTSTTTTTSTKAAEAADPASWRAGLRKTGSSSAVPDSTVSKDKDRDNLARSASSPWLAPERRQEEIGRRRPISISSVIGDNQESKNYNREKRFNDFYSRYTSLLNPNKSNAESSALSTTTSTSTSPTATSTISSTTKTSSSSTTTSSTTLPQQSSYVPLSRRRQIEQESAITDSERTSLSTTTNTTAATTTSSSSWISSPTTTSPTSGLPGQRRSFEPPKRDEERETERKAKAKRARESRRSTKGVTKEEIELAEQMLQSATKDHHDYDRSGSDDKSDKENKPEDISSTSKRRWDDKKDDDTKNGSSRRSTRESTDSGYLRNTRHSSSTSSITSTDTATTTTTPSYRTVSYRSKYSRNNEDNEADKEKEKDRTLTTDKEKDKEKEDPSQKSSAIRTRRKRENRRPTGKINLEDIQGSTKDENGESKKEEKKEDDRTSSRYSSRYSEPTSVYERTSYSSRDRPSSYSSSYRTSSSSLDKEIDYKKLYEEEKLENERLRKDVKRLQQDITDLRLDLEKARQKNESRSYDSSTDKREKRALERKLSELEEELKAMENLKADNARLKEENGALIRVISKLSK